MNASVKNIVDATGIDTATMFLDIPLYKNAYPSSLCKDLIASNKLKFVLNISFRMTSNGFVNAENR